MITCPVCAKLLPPGGQYCPYCGAPLQGAKPAPAPATATPAATPQTGGAFSATGRPHGSSAMAGAYRAPGVRTNVLRQVNWTFVALWCGVTLMGWGLAWTLLAQLYLSQDFNPLAAIVGGMGISGLSIAAAQWLVLRSHTMALPSGGRSSGWWVLALPVAWAGGAYLYQAWPQIGTYLPDLAVQIGGGVARAGLIGGVGGLASWPVARQFLSRSSARRWVALSAAAGAAVYLASRAAEAYGLVPGWFLWLTLGANGRPVVQVYDLLTAGIWGAVLGGAQYVLLRGKIRGGPWWPVLTCLGFLAAAGLSEFTLWELQFLASTGSIGWVPGAGWAEQIGVWAGTGLVVGGLQWLVLRGSVPRAGWWVTLSASGYALGWVAGTRLLPNDWMLLGLAASGLVASLPPWAAVRSDFDQARWLPAWESSLWIAGGLALAPLASSGMTAELIGPLVLTLVLALWAGGVLAYQG
jgi:hypothetical protein